ncbi:MAG: type II toxin-antitoxin system RelE/ParE family toxin [Candidatus Omnitrophota bacterium]
MKYVVIIRPEAENDLTNAFSWYEDKRKGLGYDFILQVDSSLHFIQRIPFAHPIEYKDVRKCLIKKFPYKILYIIVDEKVIVLAVIHGKRNPDLSKKRMNNA